jgi:hypothetical protein
LDVIDYVTHFFVVFLSVARGENIRIPVVGGKVICEAAYYNLCGISRTTYYTMKGEQGQRQKKIPNKRRSNRKAHTVAAEDELEVHT